MTCIQEQTVTRVRSRDGTEIAYWTSGDAPTYLVEVSAPTLLVTGANSPDPSKADIDTVAAALPDARILVLEDQPHLADVLAQDCSPSTSWRSFATTQTEQVADRPAYCAIGVSTSPGFDWVRYTITPGWSGSSLCRAVQLRADRPSTGSGRVGQRRRTPCCTPSANGT